MNQASNLTQSAYAIPLLLRPRVGYGRERRLFLLILGLAIVNLFDLGFTLIAMEQRVLVEMNPLAARVIPYGPGVLAVYKLVLVTFGIGLLWLGRRTAISEVCAWLYAGLCVGLCFWWQQIYLEVDPACVVINTAAEILPPNQLNWPPMPKLSADLSS